MESSRKEIIHQTIFDRHETSVAFSSGMFFYSYCNYVEAGRKRCGSDQ